jgi:hypothetical protein
VVYLYFMALLDSKDGMMAFGEGMHIGNSRSDLVWVWNIHLVFADVDNAVPSLKKGASAYIEELLCISVHTHKKGFAAAIQPIE